MGGGASEVLQRCFEREARENCDVQQKITLFDPCLPSFTKRDQNQSRRDRA